MIYRFLSFHLLYLFTFLIPCITVSAQTDSTKEAFPINAWYLINFKESTKKQVEQLDSNSIESVLILKNAKEITKVGKKEREGIVLVFMKTVAPDNNFYQINGVASTYEQVQNLDKNLISNLEVLTGKAAKDLYGEKGKAAVVNITIKKPESYEIVFTKVENVAEFPGGIDAWRKYLESNLHYPIQAIDHNTQGIVRVQIVLDKYGNVVQAKPLNDPGYGLANEAARVIRNGPKWVPARQNGRDVNYTFVQMVTFQFK